MDTLSMGIPDVILAVFCGFLAENQREHSVENKRAKEYARSLVHDLSNDTSQLSVVSYFRRRIEHG